jgi:NAD(P)-dependent dehydrogenase (short-subunit alcohol dehydrogenase family)
MTQIRFDGKVALVTGAGGGLGRAHAMLLASRGAKVVVNDLGGSVDGGGGASNSAADKVVAEIKAAGGEAVANYGGVDTADGAASMVETALKTFGGLHVVINNAGILRDVSFKKMTQQDWDSVLAVHVTGSMNVSKAAWDHLRDQNYGRIVNTTSAAGLYGNFGQANYSTAKLGLVGLTKTLAQEGAKNNIKVNAIAPVAKSRMTETILPPEVLAKLEPEYVASVVAYLCSEHVTDSGQVYAVGGGLRVPRRGGRRQRACASRRARGNPPERIAEHWAQISDLSEARPFANCMEAVQEALKSAP